MDGLRQEVARMDFHEVVPLEAAAGDLVAYYGKTSYGAKDKKNVLEYESAFVVAACECLSISGKAKRHSTPYSRVLHVNSTSLDG